MKFDCKDSQGFIMFEITIQKLYDMDINELTKFTYESLQCSPLRDDNRTAAAIEQEYNKMAESGNEIVLLARDSNSDEILGKLKIYTGFPEMAFISQWDPIIKSNKAKEKIARSLVQRAKKYTRHIGHKRLESYLSPIKEGFEKVRREYQYLYEREGFHRATEEASMRVEMAKWTPPTKVTSLPNGYAYEEVGKRTEEETLEAFHETFKISKDRLYLDMSLSQQKIANRYWYSRIKPVHPTSLFVIYDDKIVGFSIGHVEDGVINLGPIGLLPDHRGKGIARALLNEGMRNIHDDKDIKYAELEVDVENAVAMKLYTTFGFTEQYRQEYYAWNVGR